MEKPAGSRKHPSLIYVMLFLTFMWPMLYGFISLKGKGQRWAGYACSEPKKLDPSDVEKRKGSVFFEFDQLLHPSEADSSAFGWLKDYKEPYFTAYFVNQSDSVIFVPRQDGSLMIIREAQDKDGAWKPIEYWVPSGCGNSYDNPLFLMPGEYVVIPMYKDQGKFTTKFRLKMNLDDSIFYSDSFEGTMDPRQFEVYEEKVDGILYHGPPTYFKDK